MLVQQILASKPSQDIITVKPDISIADAVGVLSNKRIGSGGWQNRRRDLVRA